MNKTLRIHKIVPPLKDVPDEINIDDFSEDSEASFGGFGIE